MTKPDIHIQAERIAECFKAAGVAVLSISHSTNRYEQHSSYIDLNSFDGVRLPRIRISDHGCNSDYRINEVPMCEDTTQQDVNVWLEQIIADTKAHMAAKKAERATEAHKLAAAKDFIIDASELVSGGHYAQIRKTRSSAPTLYAVQVTKKGKIITSDQGHSTHKGYIDMAALEAALSVEA